MCGLLRETCLHCLSWVPNFEVRNCVGDMSNEQDLATIQFPPSLSTCELGQVIYNSESYANGYSNFNIIYYKTLQEFVAVLYLKPQAATGLGENR